MPRPAKKQKSDSRNPLKQPWTAEEIRSEVELIGLIELSFFDKLLREDPKALQKWIKFSNSYAGTLRQTAKKLLKILEIYW